MLSEIIRAMDWVQDAIVLYDEQPARGLSDHQEVTGSVNVMPSQGQSLNPHRANMSATRPRMLLLRDSLRSLTIVRPYEPPSAASSDELVRRHSSDVPSPTNSMRDELLSMLAR